MKPPYIADKARGKGWEWHSRGAREKEMCLIDKKYMLVSEVTAF